MQKWHFKISGKILIEGMEDVTMNIHPENIRDIIRVSDYLDENMPKMMMNLSIDKNLFDIIAKNAKTARMYLKIDKFDKQSDSDTPVLEPYIEDEFSIFVSTDINYNKEVDYKEAEVLGTKLREDVYKTVNIGLMPKAAINANKVVANGVAHQSSMMGIVASYMKDLHLLIEEFKYNPIKEQLMIAPQETLVQTVKYLNGINVFYDTKYLFFIDEPYCTYLISRSGDGIEKVDDIYPDVFINIHQTDDKGAVVPGMMVDPEKRQFYIDFNVLDSKYTIDHDTAKVLDKHKDIINPSKENVQSSLSSIMDAAQTIKNTMSTLESVGKQFVSTIKNAPTRLFDLHSDMNYRLLDEINPRIPEMHNSASKAISIINSIPDKITVDSGGENTSPTTIELFPPGGKSKVVEDIRSEESNMDKNHEATTKLNQDFKKMTESSSKLIYDAQRVNNYMGAVTYVNAQDAVKSTQKFIGKLGKFDKSVISDAKSLIEDCRHFPKDMSKNSNNIYTLVKQTRESLEAKGKDSSEVSDKVKELKAVEDELGGLNSQIQTHSGYIDGTIGSYLKIPPQVSGLLNSKVLPMSNQIGNIANINIKAKFKSITTDMRTLGQTAMNAIHKMKNVGKNINLSFNYSDLNALKQDINSISDLTGIGKLGTSSFESKLNLGGIFGNTQEGTKIMRMMNDNVNMVKSIHSEMENMVNQLSINKYDLDPSVFTPNKKYTIRNYHGHTEKDGIFLLNRKTEIYVREDDTFTCNTMLDFCRVLSKASADNGSASASNAQNQENNVTATSKAQETFVKNKGLEAKGRFEVDKTVSKNRYGGRAVIDKALNPTGILGNNSSKFGKILGTTSLSDILSKVGGRR